MPGNSCHPKEEASLATLRELQRQKPHISQGSLAMERHGGPRGAQNRHPRAQAVCPCFILRTLTSQRLTNLPPIAQRLKQQCGVPGINRKNGHSLASGLAPLGGRPAFKPWQQPCVQPSALPSHRQEETEAGTSLFQEPLGPSSAPPPPATGRVLLTQLEVPLGIHCGCRRAHPTTANLSHRRVYAKCSGGRG